MPVFSQTQFIFHRSFAGSLMNFLPIHPAAQLLFRHQTKNRITRLFSQLKAPRRLMLTIVALGLTVLWIGQTILSVFLREPATPEMLGKYVCFSLAAYALWNTIKVCLRKPVEPFEWTETERELLLGAPLSRTHVIQYRLTGIVSAAILKSTIFMLVMIPDLELLPAGFLGMLIGLLFIDALRLAAEVFIWGLKPKERVYLQATVVAFLVVLSANALGWTFANVDVMKKLSTAGSLGFMFSLLQGLSEQANTVWGWCLLYPFAQITKLILATRVDPAFAYNAFVGLVSILSAFWLLLKLDGWMLGRTEWLERKNFDRLNRSNGFSSVEEKMQNLGTRPKYRVPFFGGAGPLAWRQCLGFWSYKKPMLVALGIPFLLCCLPAFSDVRGILLLANVSAAVVFYSFLLLPTTCKFDFRRDVDRLVMLKSLPVTSTQVVLGQVAGPVLLTIVFQSLVFLAAFCLNPSYPFYLSLLAIAVMLPLNTVIFGFENLLFLYYPHRLNQEGIHVFVRTILAFTAKGFVFAVGLTLVIIWFLVCRQIGAILGADHALVANLIFGAGMIGGLFALSGVIIHLLRRAFDRFDPSVDLAGLD